MDGSETDNGRRTNIAAWAGAGGILLWLSQPPWVLWPLAFVALVPWLSIIVSQHSLSRRDYCLIWSAGFFYWAISLQGLRHAHPVIYAAWIALAGYLAIYPVLFVAISRRMLTRGIPIWLAGPIVWVGCESIRNYLLTGISAAMLGHTMADVPIMIQIADLFGSYGVSFVVASVNVAVLAVAMLITQRYRRNGSDDLSAEASAKNRVVVKSTVLSVMAAVTLLIATLTYGWMRLGEPLEEKLATFALIQRNEHVEYMQDEQRELEMFENYMRQSAVAVGSSPQDIVVVVWPESMFTGGVPWKIATADAKPPQASRYSPSEFLGLIEENRGYFVQRARLVDDVIARSRSPYRSRHLIAGCGVVRYGRYVEVFSGMVHVSPLKSDSLSQNSATDPVQWYGKTHLVMIGEYIPFVSYIPGLRDYVKKIGLGLTNGPGPQRFMVNGTVVAPNVCIETAVERVTVNQLAELGATGKMPDVVVTVTNDGWFDDSSVIDHHLRCAELVAVACRRPLLSAANNAPTAWIDSNGHIVQQLTRGTNGSLIATPLRDDRVSLYLRIGDWPARLLGLLCIAFGIDGLVADRKQRKKNSVAKETSADTSSVS